MTPTIGRTAPLVHRDNRMLAAVLACAAVLCATSQDSLMKYLSGGYPIHELLVIRSAAAVPIIMSIVLTQGGIRSLATPYIGLALLRGLILFVGFMSFALAFAALPLADVVTIYFTMPFFVAALAAPVLGERVGAARWLAIVAGFLGVLVMLQKDADLSQPMTLVAGLADPAALLALLSAASYGVGQLMGRPLGRHVPPAVMAFHQNLVYLCVCIVLALVFWAWAPTEVENKSIRFLTRPWIVPPAGDIPIVAAIAVLGSLAMPLFSGAYKYAEASFVAPFEYTSMFWAVVFGLLLFGDFPGPATWIGSAVIVAAGLFMIVMDRRTGAIAGETP